MRNLTLLYCLLSFGCASRELPAPPDGPPIVDLDVVGARVEIIRGRDGEVATRLLVAVEASPLPSSEAYPSGAVSGQLRMAGSREVFSMSGGWQSRVGNTRCFELNILLGGSAGLTVDELRDEIGGGHTPEIRLVVAEESIQVGGSAWREAGSVFAPVLARLR